jgi:dolichyl-phosphate beta-glucosyltransferase
MIQPHGNGVNSRAIVRRLGREEEHLARHSGTHQRSWAQRFGMYFGLFLSVAAILYLIQTVEPSRVFEKVKQVRALPLAAAVIFTMLSYVLRSYRWKFFFSSRILRFSDAFRCLIVGFFMNNVLPARMGEFVRAHLGGRATHESRTVVLATIAGERLIDGLTISGLFAILFALWADRAEREYSAAIYLVVDLFAAVAVGTILVILARHQIFRLIENLQRVFSGTLSTFTLIRVQRFIEGLEPMLRPQKLGRIAALSVAIWCVELLVYFEVTQAFSSPLNPGQLSLFLAAVNFSSLIPAGPGGVGPIEAVATEALAHIGVERELALAMVVTQHLIQILVVGIPGAFFFLFVLGAKVPVPEEENFPAEEGEEAHRPLKGKRSIIIPAFNEEARLWPTLDSVWSYLSQRGNQFEIIVVDDGSTDGTAELVRRFGADHHEVRCISYHPNRGKGFAVRTGALAAAGEFVLFNDADGSTPIAELERLEHALEEGADLAIGSRALEDPSTKVETTWVRKAIGRMFNAAANVIAVPGIADTQCGFKLFRKDPAHALFAKQKSERMAFDVEILFLAKKAGYEIAEIPINWINVPGSKVRFGIDPLQMLIDVIRLRIRDWRGEYR